MWRVLFVLTVLATTCEPYSMKHKTPPERNQRIIKIQGPPHYNHFHGHSKPIRKRPPFKVHHGDEFIRPNHPPPIPPFFNGPSTNKVKHLPRPPPHVFHKAPSYGLGFPYKSLPNYRPTITKEQFRVQTVSVRPAISTTAVSNAAASSVAASPTYHSPTFSSSFDSSPASHIISSNDNNGPIREIPAPNLAPKHHEYSADIGLGGISSIGGIGIEGVSGIGSVGLQSASGISAVGSGVGIHAVGGVGAIHEIGSIGSVSAVHGIHHGSELGNIATVGGVTHLEPQALVSSVAKNPTGVNLDAIVKDQGIEVGTFVKESGAGSQGEEHTVEIANFDEGSSLDVTNLVKNADGASEYHSGYEVTEHHNHLPSNDQIIKGHDGSKLYYAPDPDPSLPVHKVPPTNDPHSTPSNGQNLNNVYLPQIPHGFSYLQGGSVGAPLSSQELFHYMHGYPAVIQQPVVAFVQQTPGVILGYKYQEGSGNGHYAQEYHGNDITQYLQQPKIHNLIHNTPETHHEETPAGAYSSVVGQSTYSPQNQQHYSESSDNEPNYSTSEINHNFQYEPEAADSKKSLTVIRQTDERELNSETVKELLLKQSESKPPKNYQTILHLTNIPEVPFYSSLPNKKAAETLASLQAAGSIASNFMNKIKKADDGESQRGRKVVNVEDIGLQLLEAEKAKDKTVVEVQQSVPLYEASITSKNLVDYEGDEQDNAEDIEESVEGVDETTNLDLKEDSRSQIFGKRLRPK